MLLIFPSGTFFCFKDACGINFWGVHGHDAIWHMAITNVSFNKFPFIAPTFSGENLYGYNYLLDFIVFLLSKIGVPAIFSYFKLLPVIWFMVFTSLLITLGRKIKDSILFVSLFLFLNYFAGSFSYLLTLLHDKTINGSSTLLPQPIMHAMSNLPYAFSLLPLLVILNLMKDKKLNTKKIFTTGVCIFSIMGLKFYGGVISIFMVTIFVILNLFQDLLFKNQMLKPNFAKATKGKRVQHDKVKKRIVELLIIYVFVILGVFLFYDPIRSFKTGSVFGWAPFALVHPITEEPNQFYLQDMTDARYYIMAQGRIGPRFVWIEFINLTLFLFFYLGTRFFTFFYIVFLALKKRLDTFDLSVILSIIFSITLTVLLVQKAEWWNTIQFFFYAIFLLTIYLSRLVFDLINPFLSFRRSGATEKSIPTKSVVILRFARSFAGAQDDKVRAITKVSGFIVGFIILILSIPTSLDLVRLFAVTPGAAYLPVDEMRALEFLKKQPEGTVLTPVYNKEWKNYQKSNQLYTYADTAYVSAFSGKQTYFANILQLRLTGVSYEKRLEKLKRMDCSILSEVDYVYEIRSLLDEEKIVIACRAVNAKKIFENKSVNIYSMTK